MRNKKRHFNNSIITFSKKNGTIGSLFWKFSERITAQLVSTIVSIVLARILTPQDYGVISVVMILITICNVFVSNGLGSALIQKNNADELDFSTVFYAGIVLSVVLYFIVFGVSKPIAIYYKDMRLVWIFRVMALRIPIAAINSVQQAYISKRMEFQKFFFATIIGTVISAFVGIGMALNNMGPWALVAQYLTNVVIDTIVLFIVGGWYPKWMFSFKRLQLLFGFGVKILGAALLDTAFNELRSIIISARYSTTDLALYDNGRKYPNLIVTNINTSISSVIFPVMSRQQDDKNSIKNMMKKSVKMSTFTIAPLLFGLMAVAERFVEVILTEKWNGCIPYIYITCIMCVFYPIHTINIQALNAVGESAKTLKLEVVKKVLNILILLISMSYGVIGIAVGGMLVSLISTYINAIYSKKMFNYSFVQQIRDILPVIVLSLGMTIIVKIFDRLLVLNSFLMLCLDIIVGGTVYVAGAYIMKLESLEILRSKIKSLKGVHKK